MAFISNDVFVDPHWLLQLIEAMKSDPTIGIAQCKILEPVRKNSRINVYLFSYARARYLPLASIIVLNWNGKRFLKDVFNSLKSQTYSNYEVIMVDNASTDGSVDYAKENYPWIKVICNERNLGFAAGNNVGIRAARGEYIAFLNNDTKVDPNWLGELIKILEKDENIGAAQGKILLMNDANVIQSTGHFIDYFGMVFIRGYLEEDVGQYNCISEIFGASGAAFIARKKVLQEVGMFDQDFFLAFEESDLCWRIRLNGYKIVFVPTALVYHVGGASLKKVPSSLTRYLWYRNRMSSLIKNYSTINLFKYMPIHVVLLLMEGTVIATKHHDPTELLTIVKATTWNLLHFKVLFYKRKKIQKQRKVTDDFLMKLGLIRKPNMREILSEAKKIRSV